MNTLEIIVLIIFAAVILDGGRIGFVKTIFSIVKMIIGILLAAVICAMITGKLPSELTHIVPVAFLFVFGTVMGILGSVESMLNLVDKIPIAKQVNRLAGLAAGVLRGIVVVWIIFCVSEYFIDTEMGKNIHDMISSSEILMWINNINPCQRVIELMGKKIWVDKDITLLYSSISQYFIL